MCRVVFEEVLLSEHFLVSYGFLSRDMQNHHSDPPLPGACVQQCFTDEPSNCFSLLKADYSIRCFTTRYIGPLALLLPSILSLFFC